MTLTAAPGWSFAEIEAPGTSPCFTHSDGTVDHGAGTPDKPLVVTIDFPATEAAPVEVDTTIKW